MVLIGVLVASIFIFAVFYWWAEGALEASEAFILAGVFGSLIIGIFAARSLSQFLLAFIPLAAASGYAIYIWRYGSFRAYYRRRSDEYIAAIRSDPKNLAAREFLADALYNLGQLDRAVDELQAAVDLGAGIECQYKLGKWSKERYLRDTTNPVCRWCATENRQGMRTCSRCGADLPYDTAFTRWLLGGRSSGARYYLLVICGAAVVVTSLLLLPLTLAFIPLALFFVGIIGWSLVGSARS